MGAHQKIKQQHKQELVNTAAGVVGPLKMAGNANETMGNAFPDPETATVYLDPKYWNERFSCEEHYEWLKDYSHFRHLLQPHLNPEHSVLELGCGNSRLSEELYRDGVRDITCIDLSAVAVERMMRRLSDSRYEGIKFLVADMLDLPFPSESFDIVIEKGTMEVLFIDSGDPWNPRPETVKKVKAMLEGVHRVLKPEGIFISISFGQPHLRRQFFEAPGLTWSVEWKPFGEFFHYFFYTLKKGKRVENASAICNKNLLPPSISMLHEELDDENYIFRTSIDEMEA